VRSLRIIYEGGIGVGTLDRHPIGINSPSVGARAVEWGRWAFMVTRPGLPEDAGSYPLIWYQLFSRLALGFSDWLWRRPSDSVCHSVSRKTPAAWLLHCALSRCGYSRAYRKAGSRIFPKTTSQNMGFAIWQRTRTWVFRANSAGRASSDTGSPRVHGPEILCAHSRPRGRTTVRAAQVGSARNRCLDTPGACHWDT
jgi:hypothetical protein